MDPHPKNYLRQNIVVSYPEMIRVSFSLFLSLSVFCYFTLLLIFIKNFLLLLLLYLFIFMKILFIFSCSGIFRNVPCSWFLVLSTPGLKPFSIYTLSDLGDLSNLIGTLSRTIQQYSPPSEWIMYELVFFPHFLKEDLLKVDQILWLTFFRQEKTSKDSKRRFSIYCC